MKGPRERYRDKRHEAAPIVSHPATEIEAIILDYLPKGYYADPHREHRNRPVAQALGLRNFVLLDGIPLEPVEPLEYVSLAREITRTLSIEIGPGGRPITKTVYLACMPGADKHIYCYPFEIKDPKTMRIIVEAVESEDPRVMVVTNLEALKSVAKERGLPTKILVVPRRPLTYNDLSDFAKKTLEEALRKVITEREEFFVEFFNIAAPINIRLHSLNLLKGIGKRVLLQIIRTRERHPFKSFNDIKKIIKADPVDALVEKILEEIRGEARYYLFVPPPSGSNEPFLNYMDYIRKHMRRR